MMISVIITIMLEAMLELALVGSCFFNFSEVWLF